MYQDKTHKPEFPVILFFINSPLKHIESRSVGLCVKILTCGYYLSVGPSDVEEKY